MTQLRKIFTPLACLIIFTILAWLNSGTLNLYAATLTNPLISRCGYLLNIDNYHFESLYYWLHGSEGEFSTLLARRIIYPLIAYLPMTFFSFIGNPEWFILGGFISSLLIYTATIIITWLYFKQKYDKPVAVSALILLVSYPGIYYWIGSPYAYNWIVPGSVFSYIILDYCSTSNNFNKQLILALLLGCLFLGYDLWVFFLPAAIFILLAQKKLALLVPFIILAALPSIIYAWYLKNFASVELNNPNSGVYQEILSSYFNPAFYLNYDQVLQKLPEIFINNLFYSNFVILPTSFLLIYFLSFFVFKKNSNLYLNSTEKSILLAGLILFLFINLAPQTNFTWQMRGTWIARLYQPVFVAFIFYLARSAKFNQPIVSTLVGLTITANLLICLAPVTNITFANNLYFKFYQHGRIESPIKNWGIWGKRPIGFCMSPRKVTRIKKRLAKAA